jgi:transcriptional regulator with XRE-family HTH domain
MPPTPDAVGRRITRLRTTKGLSVRGLARLAGIPVSGLAALESGVSRGGNMSVNTCRKLAKALGVTLDYLVGYADDEDPAPPYRETPCVLTA